MTQNLVGIIENIGFDIIQSAPHRQGRLLLHAYIKHQTIHGHIISVKGQHLIMDGISNALKEKIGIYWNLCKQTDQEWYVLNYVMEYDNDISIHTIPKNSISDNPDDLITIRNQFITQYFPKMK